MRGTLTLLLSIAVAVLCWGAYGVLLQLGGAGADRPMSVEELSIVFLFTAMTAVAWGFYGPTLHKGQLAMAGSRLRPFICVGLAYFLIAVVVPILLMVGPLSEPGSFTLPG